MIAVLIGQERLGKHQRDLVAMDSVFIVIETALVTRPRKESEVARARRQDREPREQPVGEPIRDRLERKGIGRPGAKGIGLNPCWQNAGEHSSS